MAGGNVNTAWWFIFLCAQKPHAIQLKEIVKREEIIKMNLRVLSIVLYSLNSSFLFHDSTSTRFTKASPCNTGITFVRLGVRQYLMSFLRLSRASRSLCEE